MITFTSDERKQIQRAINTALGLLETNVFGIYFVSDYILLGKYKVNENGEYISPDTDYESMREWCKKRKFTTINAFGEEILFKLNPHRHDILHGFLVAFAVISGVDLLRDGEAKLD